MGGVNRASRSFVARERGRETKPVSDQLAAAGKRSLSADQQPEPPRVQSSPVRLSQPAARAGGRLADVWYDVAAVKTWPLLLLFRTDQVCGQTLRGASCGQWEADAGPTGLQGWVPSRFPVGPAVCRLLSRFLS